MQKAVIVIRSLLFLLIFYGGTVPLMAASLVAMPFGQRAVIRMAIIWSRYHRFCARWLSGQRIVVEGTLPSGPAFCVMKHESMFETLDMPRLLRGPAIAAKKELLTIPFWGRLARAYGIVPVDRDAGASALRKLRGDALAAIASGRALCLFPEGTRVPPGEQPPLKSGFAGLYVLLRVPVVPIAVNSGRTNPRDGFLRYPGVVRYRVGEPVPPGLDRREAEARVHAAMNSLNSDPA
ncbi:MAG: lysophospholipid acyltransferase family protein [Sphingobium sp.]